MEENFRKRIINAYRVCQECGIEYGAGISKDKKQTTQSTWIEGESCDICEEEKPVTEFRDFGYEHPRYKEENDNA